MIMGIVVSILINKMGIVVSTIHSAIRFHTHNGIGTIEWSYEEDSQTLGLKKTKESVIEPTKAILGCGDEKKG